MQMAQQLVKGMDLWINTPRRPWEACGTSGMKVLANGGLNVSELDGWWAEAYTPEVGWAIGDGREHGQDSTWDATEVESLYSLLEQQIVPEFYQRNSQGMPSRWLARVRESMATLTPEFSASRAIREYTTNHYLPAAAGYIARSANGGKPGIEILEWQRAITDQWETLRFGEVTVDTKDGQHRFQIRVNVGGLHPDQFRVELYASSTDATDSAPQIVAACSGSPELSGEVLFSACCVANRPATDYTARLVPSHEHAMLPLESGQILWQR
jgi:starch phosphorylase